MKGLGTGGFISFLLVSGGAAIGASFLQPTKFPTVASDYSFTERMENLAEDYENYAGLSAYEYLVLQTEEEAAHDMIDAYLKADGINICENCDENGNPPPQDGSTYYVIIPPTGGVQPGGVQPGGAVPAPGVAAPATGGGTGGGTVAPATGNAGSQMRRGGGYCSLRHPRIPQGQKVPLGLPVNMADMPDPSTFKDSDTKSIISNTLKGLMGAPYGCGRGRPHKGVDVGLTEDFYRQPIYATADGVVASVTPAGNNSSAGNYVRIKHDGGWVTQYMHLDEYVVKKGQQISAGCLIGYMGYTGGNSDQKVRRMGIGLTHLHYEIEFSGNASYFQAPNGKQIQIFKHKPCKRGFGHKIKPNDFMIYYGG